MSAYSTIIFFSPYRDGLCVCADRRELENGKPYDRKTKITAVGQDVVVAAAGRTGYGLGSVEFDVNDLTAQTLAQHSQKSLQERMVLVEAALKMGFEKVVKAAGDKAKLLEVPEEANFTVAVVHRMNFRIAATYLRLKFVVGRPVAVNTTHITPARLENTISCLG